MDKATLSGVLDRMLDSEWIRKESDPNDGRVFRLYTTEKTAALKEELIELRVSANEEMLNSFNREEEVLFKRLLRDLA
jgi:DNA-binding MarR family transcriptional regulator